MKCAIITLYGENNYGNKFQNYAVQKVLESFHIETVTIRTAMKMQIINQNSIKKIINILISKSVHLCFFKEGLCNNHYNILRFAKFYKFSKKNINTTKDIIFQENISKLSRRKYDFFICGSDQIWNPSFIDSLLFCFAGFASPEQRISYAASFGIRDIPKEYIDDYTKYLSEMEYISVRESAGVNIVEKLTNRKAEILIDPTLMLSKEEWLKAAKKPIWFRSEGYILTYFLGECSEKVNRDIECIEKKYNLKVISLGDKKSKKYYSVGPDEWLFLICHASIILTDSFHGTIFSFIMERSFIVYDRQDKNISMGSRIETLLETLDLKHRKAEMVELDCEDLLHQDYSNSYIKLESEKKKTIDFLTKAMGLS